MGNQGSRGQDLRGLPSDENFYGFHNFGNTCYLNSVLQALYFCLPLRKEVLSYYSTVTTDEYEESNTLLMALAELFHEINSNKKQNGIYKPQNIVKRLQSQNEMFRGLQHQDAHEFLNFLLNNIADTLESFQKKENENGKKDPTFIHNIFEGSLTNETRCLCCESVSSRNESFLDLSIDIEQNTSVTHCLRNFSSVETLRGSDKFYCNVCRSLQEAERRMRVKSVPKILVVHLKRFKYVEVNRRHTLAKLSHRVVFPFELKLPNTSADSDGTDKLYELFAIVIHLGVGGNYGHYVSLVKCKSAWILFDDDQFRKLDTMAMKSYFGSETEDTHNKTCGYLLFYQQCDI